MTNLDEPYILLAEDNRADVYLVRKSLQEHGVTERLHAVKDGEEAIRFIADVGPRHPCPRLILLDLNLPRATGQQVLERVLGNPECAHVPVIVLTSSDSPTDREDMERLGARVYFRKPTQLEEFMRLGSIVKDVLADKAVRRASDHLP